MTKLMTAAKFRLRAAYRLSVIATGRQPRPHRSETQLPRFGGAFFGPVGGLNFDRTNTFVDQAEIECGGLRIISAARARFDLDQDVHSSRMISSRSHR